MDPARTDPRPAFDDVSFENLVEDSRAMSVRSILVLPGPVSPAAHPQPGPVVIDVPLSASELVSGLGSYGD